MANKIALITGATGAAPELDKKGHPWLVIACDSCGTLVDLDLRVKPRDLFSPCCASRRALPALQWAWSPTHHCVVASSVDIKRCDGKKMKA